MSVTFTLTVACDNAAFDKPDREAEIARILRETASRIERWSEIGKALDIRDMNGNIVGQYWLEDHP